MATVLVHALHMVKRGELCQSPRDGHHPPCWPSIRPVLVRVVPLGRTACLLRARLRTRRAWSSYGYLSNVLSKERRRSAVGMQQVRCHPRSRCSSLTCYQHDLTRQPDSMLRADAPVPTAFRSNMIPRLSACICAWSSPSFVFPRRSVARAWCTP